MDELLSYGMTWYKFMEPIFCLTGEVPQEVNYQHFVQTDRLLLSSCMPSRVVSHEVNTEKEKMCMYHQDRQIIFKKSL